MKWPVVLGVIEDWEAMEKIWDHTFGNELRIDISKCNSLFVTESFGNPKANREKMATIFFETFGINKLGIGN